MTLDKAIRAARGAAHTLAGSGPMQWTWKSAWPVTIAVLLSAATALLFWPTTHSLLAEWRDTETLTYTHGYLIAAVSVWLLIRDRGALEAAPARLDYRGALVLALLSLLWLIAYRAGLQLAHQVLLPAIGWFAVWTALGPAVAQRCAFAFGFLYFAIPVWSVGNFLLQEITVVAVRALLSVSNIPAYVVGNFVHIPSGTFEIAGGCSGLHFFVVAIAIAALYGELHRDRLKTRLLLLAFAAIVAMVSNWLRVFTIIIAGHLSHMQHYLLREHYSFGWVVFAAAMALFFVVARRLPVSASEATSTEGATTTAGQVPTGRVAGVAVALVAMMIGPAWSVVAANESADRSIRADVLPADPGSWQGPLTGRSFWQPRYPGADAQQLGEYRQESKVVDVYVATYAHQRQGKELIGSDNTLLGQHEPAAMISQRIARTEQSVNELTLDTGKFSEIVWYQYRVGAKHFTRGIAAQLYYSIASLVGTPISQVIALRTQCVPDCDAARAALADLMADLMPDLIGALDTSAATAAPKTKEQAR